MPPCCEAADPWHSFCGTCGTRIPRGGIVQCTHCHFPKPTTSQFCTTCGHALPAQAIQDANELERRQIDERETTVSNGKRRVFEFSFRSFGIWLFLCQWNFLIAHELYTSLLFGMGFFMAFYIAVLADPMMPPDVKAVFVFLLCAVYFILFLGVKELMTTSLFMDVLTSVFGSHV